MPFDECEVVADLEDKLNHFFFREGEYNHVAHYQ